MYVVDGLFDVKNAEFGGRASVGLANGEACGLEDGVNHGLFVAGLVAGRRTGVAKQAKIVAVGASTLSDRFTTAGLCPFSATQLSARTMRAVALASVVASAPSHP